MAQHDAATTAELPRSPRTRVRRLSDRQHFDRAELYAILDEALLAHVAVVSDDGVPVVLPFACARDGDTLLLHGSTGAGVLRACADGRTVCVEITHLDGLVVARSAFDSSMNYRSAVLFGVPELLTGAAHDAALATLTDHLLPGRTAEIREMRPKELAATTVLGFPIDEASVKVRAAGPSNQPDDGEDRAVWAGVLPLSLRAGAPVPEADAMGLVVPASVHAAAAARQR